MVPVFMRPNDDEADQWPRRSVDAARVATLGLQEGWGQSFCKNVFTQEFGYGKDIGSAGVLETLLSEMGVNASSVLSRSKDDSIKNDLRASVAEAMEREIFGAPTFFVGSEMFWGNDRLEDAMSWSVKSK